jgi:hypothetical protein
MVFGGVYVKFFQIFWCRRNNYTNIFAKEVLPMQIDGMREFFSKIAPLNGAAGVQSSAFLPALPALAQQKQPDHDSLSLSDIGAKLRFNGGESSSLIGKQKIELTDSLPPWAQRVDKAMSQAIDILEKMHALAIAAQDKKLSDLDRVEMQIEIEDLRTNLMAMPKSLRTGKPVARLEEVPMVVSLFLSGGDYSSGDYSSVLGRMRERIMNGQEWDVREAWCPDGFTRVTYDDNGDEVWEIFEANAWYVVDDRNVLTYREGEIVDSGKKVLTVREKLEWRSPVVVMDAESAAKGTAHLEKQIASIQRWREQLPANLTKLSTEDAAAFLSTIAFPGGVIKEPLTDPTFAINLLYSDGIYDHHVARNLLELGSGGSDISLTDGEIIKNNMTAAGWVNEDDDVRIYGYSGSTLRTEKVTAITQNEHIQFIYAKGIRSLTE